MAMTAFLSLFTDRDSDKRHRRRRDETKGNDRRQKETRLYNTKLPETTPGLGIVLDTSTNMITTDNKTLKIYVNSPSI